MDTHQKINALIAEKVMGFAYDAVNVPDYTDNIADAWQLHVRMLAVDTYVERIIKSDLIRLMARDVCWEICRNTLEVMGLVVDSAGRILTEDLSQEMDVRTGKLMDRAHVFTNDLGQEIAVVGGQQIRIYNDDDPRIWQEVLNWFEVIDGVEQLCIGTKKNPDHVRRWRAWNKEMGVEV